MIAARTKAVLEAAKARGVIVGGPKLVEARDATAAVNRTNADKLAADVLPIIQEVRKSGATTLREIAGGSASEINAIEADVSTQRAPNAIASVDRVRRQWPG